MTESLDSQSIEQFCEQVTKDGAELSMKWNGGHDSGLGDLYLDGDELTETPPAAIRLLNYLIDGLDYGCFGGDYDTEGTLIYNPETKTFEGEDHFSTTDLGTMECCILIKIPEILWFDRLDIQLDADDFDELEVNAEFQIDNGPKIEFHEKMKSSINKLLKADVSEAIDVADDFSSMRESIILNLNDFVRRGGYWEYTIKSIKYTKYSTKSTDIHIPISNQF